MYPDHGFRTYAILEPVLRTKDQSFVEVDGHDEAIELPRKNARSSSSQDQRTYLRGINTIVLSSGMITRDQATAAGGTSDGVVREDIQQSVHAQPISLRNHRVRQTQKANREFEPSATKVKKAGDLSQQSIDQAYSYRDQLLQGSIACLTSCTMTSELLLANTDIANRKHLRR